MKNTTLSLSLFLALVAAPALGSSINNTVPGPIYSFQMTGIQTTIYGQFLFSAVFNANSSFNSNVYIPSASTSDSINVALANAGLSGAIQTATFNSTTDLLTGTFIGSENIWTEPRMNFRIWKYDVTGTFSEFISFNGQGTASVNITSATYVGTTAVPEAGTFALIGTGLCGIVSAVRRKLTRG